MNGRLYVLHVSCYYVCVMCYDDTRRLAPVPKAGVRDAQEAGAPQRRQAAGYYYYYMLL